MKHPVLTAASLLLMAVAAFSILLIAPFLRDARFEVINASGQAVYVTASWRDEIRSIGTLEPSTSYRFSVSDEAAMRFTGRFPDGRNVESDAVYFTGGTRLVATITDTGIEVSSDLGP